MVLKKKLTFISCALLVCVSVFANSVPALKGRVNDYANVINSSTENELNGYLASLEEQSGIQIVVLTVPSLQGDSIESYSLKVAESWKIGSSKNDDGALLVVALDERAVRIEAGYGLEDRLTDAKCGLIIRNVIIPEFKTGDYSEGILKGVKNMGGIASGNDSIVSKNVLNDDEDSENAMGIVFMIVWLIFFFIVISSKGGIWKWLFLSNMMGGNRHGRGGHFTSSSGNRSSGFGGGFGGGSSFHGGGGHFGGGGASGHW